MFQLISGEVEVGYFFEPCWKNGFCGMSGAAEAAAWKIAMEGVCDTILATGAVGVVIVGNAGSNEAILIEGVEILLARADVLLA